jgi:hypothetical protein
MTHSAEWIGRSPAIANITGPSARLQPCGAVVFLGVAWANFATDEGDVIDEEEMASLMRERLGKRDD